MKPYPSGGLPSQQLQFLQDNLQALVAFQAKYFHLRPWEINVQSPFILFPSTSLIEIRDTFGDRDWMVNDLYIRKEVDGVQVRCLLPILSKHPWEGA